MKHLFHHLRFCCICIAGILPCHGQEKGPSATAMKEAADKFLQSLDKDQREKAFLQFSDEARENWHFFPNRDSRAGIPLSELSETQRAGVKKLLLTALTEEAFLEQEDLRLIHGLKKELEAPDNPRHLYFTAIFGSPSATGTWGWRYEGHHLSLSCTLVDGRHLAVTPSFWGASPIAGKNKDEGLSLFAREREIALSLVKSFSENQRKLAVIEKGKGPGPVSTVDRKKYASEAGISYGELTDSQKKQLLELVRVYAKRYRPSLLTEIDARKKIEDTSVMTFAYQMGQGDFVGHYRVLARNYLIEFNNQNGNHVHSAWRDFDGDFGRDLIAEHLEAED